MPGPHDNVKKTLKGDLESEARRWGSKLPTQEKKKREIKKKKISI